MEVLGYDFIFFISYRYFIESGHLHSPISLNPLTTGVDYARFFHSFY